MERNAYLIALLVCVSPAVPVRAGELLLGGDVSVLARLAAEGAAPDLVQIGNEITPGMLFPDGKLYGAGDPETQWSKLAALLKAAGRGVRAGLPADAPARIVVHIAEGGKWAKVKNYYEHLVSLDVPFDVIGLSFYPFWHGTLEDARETIYNAARTFDKDVFVVETAYPYRKLALKPQQHPENMTYPSTPEGQRAFLGDLVALIRDTPGGHGLGVQWWYPESVPLEGQHIWHGGATALFDDKGAALPALGVFQSSSKQ